jgi:hypothetical protein
MDVSSAMLRRIRFLELLTRGYRSDCVSASEPFVTPIPRAEKLRPAHFVYGLVGVLHNVKLVIDDAAVRSMLLDAQTVRGDPHPLAATQFLLEEFIQASLSCALGQTTPARRCPGC